MNWVTRLARVLFAATVAVTPVLPSILPETLFAPVTDSPDVDRLVICN